MSRIGIFCRTYSRDAARLDFLLLSLMRHARGFAGVTIACPGDSVSAIEPVVQKYQFATLVQCERTVNDFIGQQLTKLNADRYVDYELITYIDSDCILTKDLTPADLMMHGKPIMYTAPYWYFHEAGINMPWQGVTSKFLDRSVEWEFMRQFPLTYPRELLGELRKWFLEHHGYPIEQIETKIQLDEFSEFNLMGAFSFYSGRNYHIFTDTTRGIIPQWVQQFCLTNSRHDRSIPDDEKDRIMTLINSDASNDSSLMPTNPDPSDLQEVSPHISSNESASSEMRTFRDARLWDEGYIDADPLNPVSWSSYTTNGFVSVYHAAYLAGIKPYVNSSTIALEIGPGRGAWTRAILSCGAPKVIALDVQPRAENGIDRFLGPLAAKLEYIEVSDFLISEVENDTIDFFWSFGTFVHLSKHIQTSYIPSIYDKMKPGAHGFIQFADLDKWNKVVQDRDYMVHDIMFRRLGEGHDADFVKRILDDNDQIKAREIIPEHVRHYEDVHPGRYFYVGVDWLGRTLAAAGFEIRDNDLMPSLRDPLIHFVKPEI